ncbi:hypothetical protein FDG2_5496 [Candidatus Protofrankia californiensis]|uniref:Uncharacterized protein n=1 Tax=Candidatus Protofrankia californiensis TaxID=1839754 RepID=A0A1C3PDU9_9ACTN|nr:hypothetical protein FDG2_5496 [Candidatus Protofrankia californiensis]
MRFLGLLADFASNRRIIRSSGRFWKSSVLGGRSRRPAKDEPAPAVGGGALVTGLADVVTLQRCAAVMLSAEDEESFFRDTLAEYGWARDVACLVEPTLRGLLQPVTELCGFYDLVPWRLTPGHLDRYFAGPGKRAR